MIDETELNGNVKIVINFIEIFLCHMKRIQL